jgi:hypothetical protein
VCQPNILPEGGIHFGAAVGRHARSAGVSVVDSLKSDDSGSKVERWPMFGGVTAPKWIPLLPDMGGRAVLLHLDLWTIPVFDEMWGNPWGDCSVEAGRFSRLG